MSVEIQKSKLFVASCLALLVTSLSFGIRAGILSRLGVEFHLNASELGTIAATAFWGFPLAVIIGGFIVDVIGQIVWMGLPEQASLLVIPLLAAGPYLLLL